MRAPFAILALAGLLTGCAAVGPDYAGPPAADDAAPAGFPSFAALTGEPGVTAPGGPPVAAAPPQDWWRTLGDPVLDALVDRALAANTDLRQAMANVQAVRAVLVQSETQRRPRVDLDASLERRRESAAILGEPDETRDAITASAAALGLAWEVDLFGRVRRAIEAAGADAERAEALRDDVLRLVIADLAQAYMELRGAQARLGVLERNRENQRRTLELTELLRREGRGTRLDVERARAQLTATEARLPSAEADALAAMNRIARLAGRPAGALRERLAAPRALPVLPAFLPVGDPAGLLRRRPDVRVAERALAGASARIGIATAALFPTVTFNAAAGLQADQPSDLVSVGAPFFSVGPALTWNVFDRERIYARIRQSEAEAAQALAAYEGVVLRALEEADSTLVRYAKERRRRARLAESVAASETAAELAAVRYREGAETFLNVLDAERSLLEAEEQLVESETAIALRLVAVYRALGGGWRQPALPAAGIAAMRE